MSKRMIAGRRSMAMAASAVAALVLSAGLARADEARQGPPDLLLGLGASAAPVYEGSDDTELSVLPIIVLNDVYGFNFRPVQLSYNLIDTGAADRAWSLRAGPLVAPAMGRDQDDDGDLRGLGDVDTGVMAGGFVEARLGPVTLSLDGAQDVADGHGGALLGVDLGARLSLSRKLVLTPSVSATWASDDYMQSFFGVTAAQAATSNYAAFDADAGIKDMGVAADLRYALSDSWSLSWNVAYTRLVGDAADSPIVTGPGGTRDQITGRIGIVRGFTF